MLSNVKRLNLFSTPLLRHCSTFVSQWCGLIKLPHIPLDGLNHKLNGKDAVVLIDDALYYAEQKNKKLLLIKKSAANELDYHQLKSKCGDVLRTATPDEVQLIKRTVSPVSHARSDEKSNESRSQPVSESSYSSTTSEVNHAYAQANEERRKKELYRNYLIFDTLTDSTPSRKKSDLQESEFTKSSGYSSDSSSHSSHSSDSYDSSNHSSSYDSGPSCGGSSYDD
jgi:hypothetical protein